VGKEADAGATISRKDVRGDVVGGLRGSNLHKTRRKRVVRKEHSHRQGCSDADGGAPCLQTFSVRRTTTINVRNVCAGDVAG